MLHGHVLPCTQLDCQLYAWLNKVCYAGFLCHSKVLLLDSLSLESVNVN